MCEGRGAGFGRRQGAGGLRARGAGGDGEQPRHKWEENGEELGGRQAGKEGS